MFSVVIEAFFQPKETAANIVGLFVVGCKTGTRFFLFFLSRTAPCITNYKLQTKILFIASLPLVIY